MVINESKANLAQFQMILPTGAKLGKSHHNMVEQAGAELCQAQILFGLLGQAA